jgi:hypothetical protein
MFVCFFFFVLWGTPVKEASKKKGQKGHIKREKEGAGKDMPRSTKTKKRGQALSPPLRISVRTDHVPSALSAWTTDASYSMWWMQQTQSLFQRSCGDVSGQLWDAVRLPLQLDRMWRQTTWLLLLHTQRQQRWPDVAVWQKSLFSLGGGVDTSSTAESDLQLYDLGVSTDRDLCERLWQAFTAHHTHQVESVEGPRFICQALHFLQLLIAYLGQTFLTMRAHGNTVALCCSFGDFLLLHHQKLGFAWDGLMDHHPLLKDSHATENEVMLLLKHLHIHILHPEKALMYITLLVRDILRRGLVRVIVGESPLFKQDERLSHPYLWWPSDLTMGPHLQCLIHYLWAHMCPISNIVLHVAEVAHVMVALLATFRAIYLEHTSDATRESNAPMHVLMHQYIVASVQVDEMTILPHMWLGLPSTVREQCMKDRDCLERANHDWETYLRIKQLEYGAAEKPPTCPLREDVAVPPPLTHAMAHMHVTSSKRSSRRKKTVDKPSQE